MKRLTIILLAHLLLISAGTAQELRFDKQGNFKIMQLTDLHYSGPGWQSDHVPGMIARLIDREKPDLIVITGDLIHRSPGDAMLYTICGAIAAQGVPYAVTLGNHDDEQGFSRPELYSLIRTLPGCVNARYNDPDERQGDFVIPVLSKTGRSEAARLYIMDSNGYNEDQSYKGFTPVQVAWYRERCAASRHGSHTPVGLMFFHYPLQEYAEAFATNPLSGVRMGNENPGRDNAGMFRALVEGGEVIATFAGHDHWNNYIAQKEGIALGYGLYSGGYAEFQELLSGARLILLKENRRGFTTWIRMANGFEKYRLTFPPE